MNRIDACNIAVAFSLSAVSMGCMSIGSVQTAQTLGRGNSEFSIEPGIQFFGDISAQKVPLPPIALAYRYGVTDRVDLGGRFGTTFAEVQTKVLLTNPDDPSLAIAFAPAVSVGVQPADGWDDIEPTLSVPLPLLVGLKFGPHELTVGPRSQVFVYASRGDYAFNLGGTLGLAVQASTKLRLLPELAVSTTVSESSRVSFGQSYMLNLGVQFQSQKKKPAGQ